MIDFVRRLLGIPPILPNGYPNMAANHVYADGEDNVIRDVTRRMNGGQQQRWNDQGGFYMPPPPPIPQNRVIPEKPDPPMIAKIIDNVKKQERPRETPSSTSSLSHSFCGSTVTDYAIQNTDEVESDPLVLDKRPLRHFLMKIFPWILDVTEVRIRAKGGSINRGATNYTPGEIYFGPLEIHITVSPIHHSELMVPSIEKKVRERLYVDLIPLISSIHVNNKDDRPIIIFSPSHSETILEYVK